MLTHKYSRQVLTNMQSLCITHPIPRANMQRSHCSTYHCCKRNVKWWTQGTILHIPQRWPSTLGSHKFTNNTPKSETHSTKIQTFQGHMGFTYQLQVTSYNYPRPWGFTPYSTTHYWNPTMKHKHMNLISSDPPQKLSEGKKDIMK